MPDDPFLSLTRLKDKERTKSWSDMSTLDDLLSHIAKSFIVDAKSIRYPAGVPMRWKTTTGLPEGVREMTADEIELFELDEPTNSQWRWVIFSTAELT